MIMVGGPDFYRLAVYTPDVPVDTGFFVTCLFIYLSIYLPTYLPIYLLIFYLSTSFIFLFPYLFIFLSFNLPSYHFYHIYRHEISQASYHEI